MKIQNFCMDDLSFSIFLAIGQLESALPNQMLWGGSAALALQQAIFEAISELHELEARLQTLLVEQLVTTIG